ncbi:hypothetical protein evm_013710 [Chilo suppressalis]|nr:hypothetical protein evm_013710 [Chilo suppressalis]
MGQNYNNEYSDYGSGNTSDSSTMSWGGPEKWSQLDTYGVMRQNKQKSSSYADLMMGRCTIDDVMQEFKMNGSDSPYTPEDDAPWTHRRAEEASGVSGMGPGSAYLRQKSWPEPERTPAVRLPPRWIEPIPTAISPAPVAGTSSPLSSAGAELSSEQLRVLGSLPDRVLRALLQAMQRARPQRLEMRSV